MEINFTSEEAQKKFKDLVEKVGTCMFITSPDKNESARPMATLHTEQNGTLWFYTHKSSGKIQELNTDHVVHLLYAHPGKDTYLDVWGTANVITDREKIKQLWNPMVKAWFPGGADDLDLCLITVKPNDVYYWDNESGKMVEFVKILASAVSGEKMAEGVEGSLELQ